MDFFLCLIVGLDRTQKYLSNEAYMCPNCYTPQVHHVKLQTKFSFFCIPLFPVSKGKKLYLCDRCRWASTEGPPQFVQPPQPPPMYSAAYPNVGPPAVPGAVPIQCPQCHQLVEGSNIRFCPHCGIEMKV